MIQFNVSFGESDMRLDTKFEESRQSLEAAFGEVIDLSEGQKQEAYQAGYEDNQANVDAVAARTATKIVLKGTRIGAYGLAYCSQLVELVAPNVKSLSTRAITECNKLVRLDFPSLTSIGTNSIYANDNLTTVILRANSVCSLSSSTSISSKVTIYVPDDLLGAYKTANKWSAIADRIKPISELPPE